MNRTGARWPEPAAAAPSGGRWRTRRGGGSRRGAGSRRRRSRRSRRPPRRGSRGRRSPGAPRPPYSRGVVRPSNPASARWRICSTGGAVAWSARAARVRRNWEAIAQVRSTRGSSGISFPRGRSWEKSSSRVLGDCTIGALGRESPRPGSSFRFERSPTERLWPASCHNGVRNTSTFEKIDELGSDLCARTGRNVERNSICRPLSHSGCSSARCKSDRAGASSEWRLAVEWKRMASPAQPRSSRERRGTPSSVGARQRSCRPEKTIADGAPGGLVGGHDDDDQVQVPRVAVMQDLIESLARGGWLGKPQRQRPGSKSQGGPRSPERCSADRSGQGILASSSGESTRIVGVRGA